MWQFLDSRGRFSLMQYRRFLLWYGIVYIPLLTVITCAFLILGYRSSAGLIRTYHPYSVAVIVVLYLIAFFWPFFASTARRLHDLGCRARDVVFTRERGASRRIGHAIFFDSGYDRTNVHGKNPGKYE